MNMAFMVKLGWRLLNVKDALWVQIVRDHIQTSNAWKGIVQDKHIVEKCSRAMVGNGDSIQFWLDKWVVSEPLINLAMGEVGLVEKYKMVRDYWDVNEGWNWSILEGKLPMDILDKIATVILSNDLNTADGASGLY